MIEVIGPFPVTFDTPGVSQNPYAAELGPVLPVGTMVMHMWVVPTVTWVPAAGTTLLQLAVGEIGDYLGVENFVDPVSPLGADLHSALLGTEADRRIRVLQVPSRLIFASDDDWLAGEADVYALIVQATP